MTGRETKREVSHKLMQKMNLGRLASHVDSSGASTYPLHSDKKGDEAYSIVRIDQDIPSITINGEVISEQSGYKVVRYNDFLAIFGDKIDPTVIDMREF